MFRVLIADDHPIVLRGLNQILDETRSFQKITMVKSGEEALEKIRVEAFDIVLLDISMPGMNGMETLEEIRKLRPSLPVLILSMYPEKDYALRALKTGASGYLTKQSAPAELGNAVKKILAGGRYISPTLADLMVSNLNNDSEKPPHERLSNREFQVMGMLVTGKSIKEIGGEMSLSPKTISTFRSRILMKLDVENNADLVKYAIKYKLFEISA